MKELNVAYDLTLYEEQREIKVKQIKAGKTIKAKVGMSYNIRRTIRVMTVAVVLGLTIAVLNTNASVISTTRDIAYMQNSIVELESEKAYIDFSIESRMSLKEIEEYAVRVLGLVKLDSSQVEYVELEEENIIEVTAPDYKEKIEEAVQPIMSYFLP